MPLDKITVASLCRKLGISRKAFYTRFESRETVLDSILYDDIVAPIKVMYPALTRTVEECVSSRILNEQVYRALADHGEFYTRLVMLNDESQINHVFQKCFRKAQEYSRIVGDVAESDKYEYAALFLAAANAAIVIHWLRDDMKTPIPTIAEWFDSWSMPVVFTIAKKHTNS